MGVIDKSQDLKTPFDRVMTVVQGHSPKESAERRDASASEGEAIFDSDQLKQLQDLKFRKLA